MIADNPFLDSDARPTVCVAAGEEPYRNTQRALQVFDLSQQEFFLVQHNDYHRHHFLDRQRPFLKRAEG